MLFTFKSGKTNQLLQQWIEIEMAHPVMRIGIAGGL